MSTRRGLKDRFKNTFKRKKLDQAASKDDITKKIEDGTFGNNGRRPEPAGFSFIGADGVNDGRFVEPTPPQSHISRPSNPRNWSNDAYAMAPTEAMAKRVAKHHTLIRKITGFLIHPNIQSTLSKNARIADLNTGTGKFLLELAGGEGMKYELVGFDTMPDIFPGQPNGIANVRPPNAIFYDHSILKRFEKRHMDYFDSVHTSFLGPVLVAGQWSAAFDNMIALAKPGGFIQWIDVNLSGEDNRDRVYISKAGTTKIFHQEMLDGIAFLDTWFQNTVSGGKRLAEIARAHPSVYNTLEEVYNTAQLNEVRKEIDALAIQAWKRLLEQLVNIRGSRWDPARVDRVVKGMEKEVKNGVYIPLEVYVVVAQKAYPGQMDPDDNGSIQRSEELQLGAHIPSTKPNRDLQKQGPSREYQEALEGIAAAERGLLANDPQSRRQDAMNGQIRSQDSSLTFTESETQRFVQLTRELSDISLRQKETDKALEKTDQISRDNPETDNRHRRRLLTEKQADLAREESLKASEQREIINRANKRARDSGRYGQVRNNIAGDWSFGDEIHSKDAGVGGSNDQIRSQETSKDIPTTRDQTRLQITEQLRSLSQTEAEFNKEAYRIRKLKDQHRQELESLEQQESELRRKGDKLPYQRKQCEEKIKINDRFGSQGPNRELPIHEWRHGVQEALNEPPVRMVTAAPILGLHNARQSGIIDPMPTSEPSDIDPELSSEPSQQERLGQDAARFGRTN